MSDTSPRRIVLAGETDFDGFRHAVRGLLAGGVAPERVSWSTQDGSSGSFDWSEPQTAAAAAPVTVPAAFVALCRCAILHRDPQRFGLLYRLLWRLLHEPALRHDPLDADPAAAQALARAVRRDLHKMKAFVRFRELRSADTPAADSSITHIAWFEPEHHIVEAVAPFFAGRFANLRWAILTPARSVRWDGEHLAFGPGARREDAPPADAGERLWLVYYEHIFNPARLKLAAMQKEMPRRYWHNLPEARLIQPLAAQAAARSEAMVAREAALPRRRLPQASVKPRGGAPAGNAEDARDETNASDAPGARLAKRTPHPRATEGLVDADGAAAAAHDDSARDAGSTAGGRAGDAGPSADGKAAATRALAALREATDRCRECPIGEHATQSVLGEGPPGAPLMLVGEQPGDQEDLRGRPFVGPAGQLLDRALAELGWPRDAVYVTNAVKHFKFELRGVRRIHKTPGQREAAACLHWLQSEIEQVRPRAFVALGATAARSLLGRVVGVTAERGRWLVREDGRRVLVTLHPSALLRLQAQDRQAAYTLWLADLAHASELLGSG